MKVCFLKPVMVEPRFHFDWTIELSKYMEVMWICGWMLKPINTFESYVKPNHQVLSIGKGSAGKKIKGLWQEIVYVTKVIGMLRKQDFDLVLVFSHRFAFIYPFFLPKAKLVLVPYTTTVCKNGIKRRFWDVWNWLVSRPYRIVLVATEKMIDMMRLTQKKCYVVRWGMNPLSSEMKHFAKIDLLYIGTLSNRRIHETITGLKQFLNSNPGAVESYSIIGSGSEKEVQMLLDAIDQSELDDLVTYYGYLHDNDIRSFFDRCNVGVAYVPITEYYNDVIVTKAIEYLISGMAVIATETNENRKMLKSEAGVLIQDSPESFAEGMASLFHKLGSFQSELIKDLSKEWTMEYNAREVLVPILKEIAGK